MKEGIHPNYGECTVICGCGNTFKTGSVKKELRVDVLLQNAILSSPASSVICLLEAALKIQQAVRQQRRKIKTAHFNSRALALLVCYMEKSSVQETECRRPSRH